jgi:hypothetical protein
LCRSQTERYITQFQLPGCIFLTNPKPLQGKPKSDEAAPKPNQDDGKSEKTEEKADKEDKPKDKPKTEESSDEGQNDEPKNLQGNESGSAKQVQQNLSEGGEVRVQGNAISTRFA